MKSLRDLIPLVILVFVFKFVDRFSLEAFNIRLSLILFVFLIIYWFVRNQIRKKAEEKEFAANGMDKNKFILLGSYLMGLPSIPTTINIVLSYSAEKVLNIYNATKAYKKELVVKIDLESIKHILIENYTLVEKRFEVEDLKNVLLLNKSTKDRKLSDVVFLIIKWEFKNSLQTSVFAFGFEKKYEMNFEMATIAQNSLKQNLSHFSAL